MTTLTIVSSGSPGAVSLDGAAKKLGWNSRLIDASDPSIVQAITASDHVIYRVSPRSYPVLSVIVDELPAEYRPKLQAALEAFDKIKTSSRLSAHAIPTPRSWILDQTAVFTGEQFVIKVPNGNQGRGVALIKSDADLRQFMREYPSDRYLGQAFIATDAAADKRLFVIGDSVVAAMKRSAINDDFRSNVSLGGKAEPYSPTKDEIAIAVKATQALKLDFSGIDIINDGDAALVLDVNPSPGFFVGTVAGVDLATAVINHLPQNSTNAVKRGER